MTTITKFMFSKLKQFKDLRSQAKQMQNALSEESVSSEKNGVKISMNGNMEITSIDIPEDLSKDAIAEAVKYCVNDCIKKTQKLMAKKMQEMGGLPGLGG